MSAPNEPSPLVPTVRIGAGSIVLFGLAAALVGALTSAAGAFVLLKMGPGAKGGGPSAGAEAARAPEEPVAQQGTVKPEQASGIVYYPVPYASPPHLTLTAKAPGRKYLIAQQDELSFVWSVAPELKDLNDVKDLESALKVAASGGLRPGPNDELAWEAKGVRAGTGAPSKPFEQRGTFKVEERGQEGEVFFVAAYALPPNVVLDGVPKTAVTSVTPLGFAWKFTGAGFADERGTVTWKAKGARATGEQLAEHIKNASRLQPRAENWRQSGSLNYSPGLSGQVGFGQAFATPPSVEVTAREVIVKEVTTTSFKWEANGTKSNSNYSTTWTAKGTRGLAPPAPADKK